jgi:hypothetical protein
MARKIALLCGALTTIVVIALCVAVKDTLRELWYGEKPQSDGIKSDRAVDFLVEVVSEREWWEDDVFAAVEALRCIGKEARAAAPVLVNVIEDCPVIPGGFPGVDSYRRSTELKMTCAQALRGMLSDEFVVEMLDNIIRNDKKSPAVRWQAVYIMGNLSIRSEKVVSSLSAALSDSNKDVREVANEALQKMGRKK